MEKILSLDVGKKKIGIAMSDLLGFMANPYATIRSKSQEEQMDKIIDIIKENKIKKVVVGNPKRTDGKESQQALWTKKFVDELVEKYKAESENNLEIIYIDERFTSELALRDLEHMSMKKIKEKGLIDSLAAAKILETYLNQEKNNCL